MRRRSSSYLTRHCGLKRASANVQQALKELLMADNYIEGSIGINLLVGSLLLGVYRVAATASTNSAIVPAPALSRERSNKS